MKEFLNHLVSGVCYIPILGAIFGCWDITSTPPKKTGQLVVFCGCFRRLVAPKILVAARYLEVAMGSRFFAFQNAERHVAPFSSEGCTDTKKRFMVFQVESCSECKQTIPQKNNIDTKNGHVVEESTFSKPSFWVSSR